MPRQGRINIEGGIYHIIQRGLERREIFKDDKDREEFLNRLETGLESTKHKCYGWVLMPNHFHLLIRTSAKPLSDLMRKLATGYALYFNKKHKRSGYLYQGRYKSILCQEEEYLLELLRYIHLNPLRARMVQDMQGLRTYKWSGHSVLIGVNKQKWQSTGEILERFGKTKTESAKNYEKFVSEVKDMNRREDLTGGGLIRSAGGWTEILKQKRSKTRMMADERILGDGIFVTEVLKETEEKMKKQDKLKREGWTFEKLTEKIIEKYKIEKDELQKKGRNNVISEVKSILAYQANKQLGVKTLEIMESFDCTRSAVNRLIRLGEKILSKDPVKSLF